MIRAAIVDDEPPARRKLRRLLGEDPGFEVVGEAGTGAEAVTLLHDARPHLVFLDIQLPDCSGFEVLESLESRGSLQVIFVTAFDDFAMKAFEVYALDYLLKPVDPSKFTDSLRRAKQFLQASSHRGHGNEQLAKLDQLLRDLREKPGGVRRLLVQETGRSFFVEADRIDWLESARNYVCLHVSGKTHVVRSTLESLAAKLGPDKFRRVSRSEIINIERIEEIRPWFHGDQKVILKDGTELTWSRRYRPNSLESLERF
jgi:two-component system, LytTR family, response regulator